MIIVSELNLSIKQVKGVTQIKVTGNAADEGAFFTKFSMDKQYPNGKFEIKLENESRILSVIPRSQHSAFMRDVKVKVIESVKAFVNKTIG